MTEHGKTSACRFQDQELVTPVLFARMGLDPARMYETEEIIAAIARRAKEEGGRGYVLLPFCHTTEAAALGADIKPADRTAGPRPGAYTCQEVKQVPARPIAQDPVIARLLGACHRLHQEGEKVVYPITGPISILSCMMDLSVLFKSWRKEPEQVAALWEQMRKTLLDYVQAVRDAGADMISYADPAGNEDILGPRYHKLLTQGFTLPFLLEAVELCGAETMLTICPLAAASLRNSGVLHPADAGQGQLACGCIKSGGIPLDRRLRLAQ